MKTTVYNQKGESVGEVELNPKIFEVKPNTHLLAEAVRVQQSNARQGTSNTKTRGEVRGGGKKPWKQKGTGRARAGSTRSPIWRHGGVTFGPRANQNWHLKMNKKAKTSALFMSLSDKAKENQFIVIDQIVLEKGKTKEFVKVLNDINLAFSAKGGSASGGKMLGKKQLFIMPKKDDKLSRVHRNLQSVTATFANSLNVVDVLKANSIVILKDALAIIEKVYLKKKE